MILPEYVTAKEVDKGVYRDWVCQFSDGFLERR
jgi:hypothetical protein